MTDFMSGRNARLLELIDRFDRIDGPSSRLLLVKLAASGPTPSLGALARQLASFITQPSIRVC